MRRVNFFLYYSLGRVMFHSLGVCTLLGFLTIGSQATSGEYAPGFVWDRSEDWTPGTVQASTLGNPDDDQMGNSTWSYEWVQGGPLGSDDPWYENPGTLLFWDNDWFGDGIGLWQRHNDENGDGNPGIGQIGMSHNQSSFENENLFNFIPLIRWTNPTGSDILLKLAGILPVRWSGSSGISVSDVDVAFAQVDGETGDARLLFSQTLSPPLSGDQTILSLTDLGRTIVGPDDEIIISLRAHQASSRHWIRLIDNEMILKMVLPGDTNLDGWVDAVDLNELALNWQRSVDPSTGADFNGDGFVGAADLNELALNWQKHEIGNDRPFAMSFGDALVAANIPEPMTLALLLGGSWTLFYRWRAYDLAVSVK